MRHLLLAGVIVLTSTPGSAAQAQEPALDAKVKGVTFVNAQLQDALTLIAQTAGITIEFDATVTERMRRARLAQREIRLVDVTVEEALVTVISPNGLTYTVIGPKAIRISKKP